MRVWNDEIVNTLKESAVSIEFVVERIKEIVEESIGNDHTMFSDLFDGHS
jgi:hypothetical protein